MANKLKVWLQQQSEKLCAATLYRALNMLPDERDVSDFLKVLADHVDKAREKQLSSVQSWAMSTIGRDVITASDWLTILRVLKEEIRKGLMAEFSAEDVLRYLGDMDYILTLAVIEAAQLTSYMGQADMLEHMVQLRENLEKLERSKSNFITVGAHELRTPLTILEGYANMLRGETEPDSQLRLYVDGMENGLLRMQETIGDMIDVSLIDLQSFELSYQQTNLEKVILLVADNLGKHFAVRQIDLVIMPFNIEQRTYSDPTKLVKAFSKVLMNALKYTPDHGRVTVTGRVVRESEAVGEIAGYIQIQIQDTGIGIDPENLEIIFNKFANISDASLHSSGKTKFKGGGPGLGLPITKGIIEAHGGRIWAESIVCDEESCPGSTFFIELPIYLSPPASVDGVT